MADEWWTFVGAKHPGYRFYWRGRWGVDWHWPHVWRSMFWVNAGVLLALAAVAFFMLAMWIAGLNPGFRW